MFSISSLYPLSLVSISAGCWAVGMCTGFTSFNLMPSNVKFLLMMICLFLAHDPIFFESHIAESLSKGDKVELRNFGVFDVKTRKARVGRNPNEPETDVPIPARSVVKFKPGKEMAEHVIKIPPKSARK